MGQKSINRIVKAFYEGKTAKDKHDRCENYELFYRDNVIAQIVNGNLYIDACGWLTNTTKSRLNQLYNVHIKQIKGKWYLNDSLWDGKYTKVEDYKPKIKQQKQTLFS